VLSGGRPARWGAGTITMTGHLRVTTTPVIHSYSPLAGSSTNLQIRTRSRICHETADHAASNYTLLPTS
jgi:hypothetical protein